MAKLKRGISEVEQGVKEAAEEKNKRGKILTHIIGNREKDL